MTSSNPDRLSVFSVQPLLYVMQEKQTIRLSACEKRLMCFKFRVEVLLETTNPEPYSGPETQDCGIVTAHYLNQSHKLCTQNVGKLHYITVLFSCVPIRFLGLITNYQSAVLAYTDHQNKQ